MLYSVTRFMSYGGTVRLKATRIEQTIIFVVKHFIFFSRKKKNSGYTNAREINR